MTFGKFKSFVENKLIESYKDENLFKKNMHQFKSEILEDKTTSKIFSIYDQLSSPQGLSEKEAKEFLEEGIDLLTKLLPNIKLPKYLNEGLNNGYHNIDVLVYNEKIDIQERLKCKKALLETLMRPKKEFKSEVNLPIKTMVNIANKTIKNHIDTLDEESKREFLNIINEDNNILLEKFNKLKEDGVSKLNSLLENEKDVDIKEKITETINKLKTENFNHFNFIKIKNLIKNI